MPEPIALALACTLTPSPDPSSTETLARQVVDALGEHGVGGSVLRVVDHDVRPGVSTDEGDGDAWPAIRRQVLAADILVLVTPIWLGHPSSVAQRVLERLDAELAETDEDGRPIMFDKVAVVGVVGNEDGAHLVSSQLFQGLNDVGYTIPAHGVTYWVGEAMESTDYRELPSTPQKVAQTTATVAANAAHLARVLSERRYPA